jgi:hypothetical protein
MISPSRIDLNKLVGQIVLDVSDLLFGMSGAELHIATNHPLSGFWEGSDCQARRASTRRAACNPASTGRSYNKYESTAF